MLDSKSDKLLHLFIVIDGKVLVRKNSFPCSKLRDSDAYSSVLTGARIMINKLGNSDIRKFTVNKNYESIVNWNTMDEPDKGLIPNEYIGLDLKLF